MDVLAKSGKTEENDSVTVSQLIENVTSQSSDHCLTFDQICDVINSHDQGPEEAVSSIRKNFETKDQSIMKITLSLLDSCVKNCGERFRSLIFSRDFLQNFLKIVEPNNDSAAEVKTVALNVIRKWETSFQEVPELKEICKTYEDLLNKNVDFDPEQSSQNVSSVKPNIEILLHKDYNPKESDRLPTPSDQPTVVHCSSVFEGDRSRSPSPGFQRIANQKESSRLSEHRRSHCPSPKIRKSSGQSDSSETDHRRSRSPSPIVRRCSKNSELSELSATLSSHLGLGERRRSRCQSPKSRRGSRQLEVSMETSSSPSTREIERRRGHFSSPKNRRPSGQLEAQQLHASASARGNHRGSPSTSIARRNDEENELREESMRRSSGGMVKTTELNPFAVGVREAGSHDGIAHSAAQDLASDMQSVLQTFQQKCQCFAQQMSVLKTAKETHRDREHLEELSLILTEIKKEIVRLLVSSEGDRFKDELRSLYDDFNNVLFRYKRFRRCSIEKAIHGSLTITESDEVSNDQTALGSNYESQKATDKKPANTNVSSTKNNGTDDLIVSDGKKEEQAEVHHGLNTNADLDEVSRKSV